MIDLVEELRKSNSKLQIELEDKCIKSSNCDYGDKYDISVIFIHDKGSIEFGVDFPTRRENLGYDDKKFENLSYQQKKEKIIDEVIGYTYLDETYDSECPWVHLDKEGNIDKSTNTEEKLNQWLDESTSWDDNESYGDGMSEYLPGFVIFNYLDDKEKNEIGMREGYVGSPGSSIYVVLVDDVMKFKQLLIKYDLPFYLDE